MSTYRSYPKKSAYAVSTTNVHALWNCSSSKRSLPFFQAHDHDCSHIFWLKLQWKKFGRRATRKLLKRNRRSPTGVKRVAHTARRCTVGTCKKAAFAWLATNVKGSVDRSLIPIAIFLIFTRNRPWMSEDHLSTLFFIEMSKERLEKSERTLPVSWRPWALAYSRDRPYNLSCLSAMSKNGRLRSFSSALGCHLARKSLWWPAILVSNKKQEFEQRKRIKLFDDFWVRAYRFDFSPRRRPRARSM